MFDNNNVSDVSVIKPAERIEDCFLVKMERDKDPQSKSFRAVTFSFTQPSTGSKLDHREFAPNRVLPTKTLSNEEFKKNIAMAHSRVAHITRAFLDEETFKKIVITGDLDKSLAEGNYGAIDTAWDQYIVLTAQALGATATNVAKAVNVPCALKVVYKGKYAALPMVPPFISTSIHPKVFTTNAQYDKYVQDAIMPDREAPNNDAFKAPASTAPANDFTSAATNHPSGF